MEDTGMEKSLQWDFVKLRAKAVSAGVVLLLKIE